MKNMEKIGYRIVGPNKHSAVKICSWTRNSLRGRGVCYKEKFYGIQAHRCLQMSPAVPFCTNNCLYCWRLRTATKPEWSGPADDPDIILDEAIQAQRKLLQGFAGNQEAQDKFYEAERPNQVAISLDGEPTLYPKLNGLISEVLKRKMTAFLVTNGTMPKVIENLTQPTQLYISLSAPNKEIHKKTCQPLLKDAWERLQKSISFLQNFTCNTVIRLTLVKNLNMTKPDQYAKIIDKSNTKFVECKAYMCVGGSRKRLKYEQMPSHEEIQTFAKQVAEHSGYKIKDEQKESRVVLLTR